jgi:hypothetical protein
VATYLESLSANPERLRRGLTKMVEDQEAYVNRLQALLDEYVFQLDVNVLRFLALRQKLGPGHGETMEAERRTEDSSKPVTELRQVVARQSEILELFRGHLREFERTGAVASLATGAEEVPMGSA